jgi:hypothetical protein
MERDASVAAAALFAMLATIPNDPGQTVDLRRGRTVMCGDCGPSVSIFDKCNWCNAEAVPIATTKLKGGTQMVKIPVEKKVKIKRPLGKR